MSKHPDTDPTETAVAEALPVASRIAEAVVAGAVGALAMGAIAIGALAIGRLGVGRLGVGKAKFKAVEIRDLTVHHLHVLKEDRPK